MNQKGCKGEKTYLKKAGLLAAQEQGFLRHQQYDIYKLSRHIEFLN